MAACSKLDTDAIVTNPTLLPRLNPDNKTYVIQLAVTGC